MFVTITRVLRETHYYLSPTIGLKRLALHMPQIASGVHLTLLVVRHLLLARRPLTAIVNAISLAVFHMVTTTVAYLAVRP
jgi:hypothetical protein